MSKHSHISAIFDNAIQSRAGSPDVYMSMVQSEGLYRAPESANPSGHPTDPSQMAVTMEMSASANQITGFNTRVRQDSCVRPLSVTKINFAEALPQHEPFNWTTIRTLINSICLPL